MIFWHCVITEFLSREYVNQKREFFRRKERAMKEKESVCDFILIILVGSMILIRLDGWSRERKNTYERDEEREKGSWKK